MKHLLPILLHLAWLQGAAFAQAPLDSDFSGEKEDSMSTLSIKPVKRPKKLLKQVINRLHKDLKETHQARSYHVEGTFRKGSLPPFSISCTYHVEGDNGLEVISQIRNDTNSIKTPKMEDFRFEGQARPNAQDSVYLKFNLLYLLDLSPSHMKKDCVGNFYPFPPFVDYEETARWFYVKAYEIDYGQGKGVYRILLKSKKNRYLWRPGDVMHWILDYEFTAYFDRGSLRITQFKGQSVSRRGMPYPWNWSMDGVTRFLADYDEDMGTPVLKRIRIVTNTERKSINGTVRRIGE